MKIKMSQAMQINRLYPKFNSRSLPIKVTYKLSKLFSALSKEEEFYSSEFKKLLEEYAMYDEEGRLMLSEDKENILLRQDELKEAQKKFMELENLEVEIPDIEFSLDDLDGIELSIEECLLLTPFINE